MYYLTEEDYAVAKSNGIDRGMAYNRYYRCGYTVERALTEEVTKPDEKQHTPNTLLWRQWKDVAAENDIDKKTFYNRLHANTKKAKGSKKKKVWTAEEAATIPKGATRFTTIQPEIYILAEKNKISKQLLRNRIFNLHWNPVKAATKNDDLLMVFDEFNVYEEAIV